MERVGFKGDTYLRLYDGNVQVASNNNSCDGSGSQLYYTPSTAKTLQVRAGCAGNTSCSGNVSYTLDRIHYGFYSAQNTNDATQNTVNHNVELAVGDEISFGTCGMTGSVGPEDTYIRLYRGATLVASNDNGCVSGLGSRITYRAAVAGTHQMRFGCKGNIHCAAGPVAQITRAIHIRSGNALYPFAALTSTDDATKGTSNTFLWLREGQRVRLGTCPSVSGGAGIGDTFLRLYGPTGSAVSSNDNSCTAAGGGSLSTITYTVPAGAGGAYELRAGCADQTLCSGVVGYFNL